MSRRYISIALLFFVWTPFMRAQCDSACSAKCCNLKEVTVSCHGAGDDALYNYYHQNKLPTTEEILARMPGLSLIRRGDYGMEPALRCYSAGQISTTISGMKIFSACTDHMDPVSIYIEPNNLESIDVAQGASGSKYGSTIGGSLNMDVKEAPFTPDRRFYVSAASSYSSVNNGYNGNMSLMSTGPKVSFRIGAVYRRAQDYEEGGGVTVLHSGYEKANFSASASIKLRSWEKLVMDYIGDFGWNIGFPALSMDTRRARANIASIAYTATPDRKVLKRVETKVYFNQIYHLMDNSQRTDAPMQMTMPGWSATGGAYADMKLAAGRNNQVELRGDYYANYTKASMTMFPENAPNMYMLTLPDNLRQLVGAYAGDEWQVAPNHIFRFNVREEVTHASLLSDLGRQQWGIFTDTTTTTKFLPSGSVQYTWLAPRHFSVSLTGAYGSSAPSGNQLYGYYLFNALDNYDYIGNPSLKTEKSLQADASVGYNHNILGINLTGFYHHLYDYIIGYIKQGYTPIMYGSSGVKQYSNLSGAFVTGVDATASLNLKQGFQSMNTVTYSYGTLSDGNPVPMLSPLRGISSVRYTYRGWHIQAETDWATAKDRINTAVGETSSPAYALLNLRTGYKFVYRNHVCAVNLSVENLLDEKYRTYSDWGTVLRPGRDFVVYLSYTFGK